MPKFEANMNYIPPSPPSSMKQCNKSATVKFHMELLLTTTTQKQSRNGATPDTLTCIVIHGGQFTGGVHPPNQFVPEIVSPLLCSPALVGRILLIVYFFLELISFIGSLDKCHTSVFNALIHSIALMVFRYHFRDIGAASAPI